MRSQIDELLTNAEDIATSIKMKLKSSATTVLFESSMSVFNLSFIDKFKFDFEYPSKEYCFQLKEEELSELRKSHYWDQKLESF